MARPSAGSIGRIGAISSHRSIAAGAVRLVTAAGVALSLCLPFVKVGSRSRSAFATLRSARVLGLTDGSFRSLVAVVVVLTPTLFALLVLLHAMHPSPSRSRAITSVASAIATVGALVGGVGLWVSRLSLSGPPTAIACAALLFFITFQGLPTMRGVDEPPEGVSQP